MAHSILFFVPQAQKKNCWQKEFCLVVDFWKPHMICEDWFKKKKINPLAPSQKSQNTIHFAALHI